MDDARRSRIRTLALAVLALGMTSGLARAQLGLGGVATSPGPVTGRVDVARGIREALAQDYLQRFAPVIRQDTAEDGSQDWITAVDFDGNWILDDSWESQGERAGDRRRHPHRAVVYSGAVLTRTHVFLTYAWFHPRDWGNGWKENHGFRNFLGAVTFGRVSHSAHENDLEGALLVVDRERDEVVVVETIFHRLFQKYWLEDVASPARGQDGEPFEGKSWNGAFPVDEDGRPVLRVESHGHGVQAWDGEPFPGRNDDGVVYFPGDRAGDPEDHDFVGGAARFRADREGRVREVPYELVSLEEELWPRARARDGDVYGDFRSLGEFYPERVGVTFVGDDYGRNKAMLPWSWTDEATDAPAGLFFFDPARMMAEHFEWRTDLSRRYIHHPYRAGGPS